MSRAAASRRSVPPAPAPGRPFPPWAGPAVIVVATVLAYLPALRGGYVWNDVDYVTEPALRSLGGLWRIWTEIGATEQYYPLLHSAFWVQFQLWGDNPLGYHLTLVLQHAAAACLFVVVLRRLAVPGAWLAGAVFALHPVAVESVAWIAEQKNTLSIVFYLGAAAVWLRDAAPPPPRRRVVALLLFAAGVLTKTTTATLPAALLVIAWWRTGTLGWTRDFRPLLPWLVLGAGMGLLSAWVEREFIGAEGEDFALGFVERFVLAGRIAWFYVGKVVWPVDLVFIYPRWEIDAGAVWQWAFPLGAVAVLAALWLIRGRTRAPLAVALLYGGTLFPVLGFFNVYAFVFSYVADHWAYLPMLPLIAALAAAAALAAGRLPRPAAIGAAGVVLALLGVQSSLQSRMYADEETLYRETLKRNPNSWMSHNNLGTLLRKQGKGEQAMPHFLETVRLKPDSAKGLNNVGLGWLDRKRPAEALPYFERAAALIPRRPEYHDNLATTFRELGRLDEALARHREAVRLDPGFHVFRNNFGASLRAAGRSEEAIAQFLQALRLEPAYAPAHLNLALSYSLLGRNAEARRHYAEARRLNPALPDLPLP